MMQKPAENLASEWISANAGSGKTRALVERVLRLLVVGVPPERIVCLTYTKAAAAEMRSRILGQLRQLMAMDAAECAAQLALWLVRPATEEEIARARNSFAVVLDSPSGGVQLTTIHGFCQQILRKFPMEAGIMPHFTVLEDSARETLQAMARQRLFTQEEGTPLSAAMALLADRSGEARVGALLDAIAQQQNQWRDVFYGASLETVGAMIDAHLEVPPPDAAPPMLIVPEEIAAIRAALPLLIGHKNKAEQALGTLLAAWLEQPPEQTIPLALQEALIGHMLTQDNRASSRAFGKTAPIPDILARIQARCLAYRHQQAALACAEESRALAHLAYGYLALLEQIKAQLQTYDYYDLILLTRQLFSTPAMVGWVMRKLDHRIDHLLIDEAQDTSPDQWAIARELVTELIAANDGGNSGIAPRSLLVVGDPKQSIFGFQGADPHGFAREKTYFHTALQTSAAPLQTRELLVSYRSAAAILHLVDAVAALPEIAPALAADSGVVRHTLHRSQVQGSVTLHPLLITEKPEKPPPFTVPTAYVDAQSAAQCLADRIAGDIACWLREKRWLASENRPIAAGDILILVHRRQPMAPCLIRALEAQKLPVAGIDRLLLSAHLAVRDLLALMRWCVDSGDDLALAQVLRSPILGMSDAALRAIAVHRSGTLWAALQEKGAAETLAQLNAMAAQRMASPYDFLTYVLEVQGARQRFATRFGNEVHEILDELKMQAAQMSGTMPPTLRHFEDAMSRSQRIVKREAEEAGNQLRIMTVHGAKGLEAPLVILADTIRVPDLRKELVYFTGGSRPLPLIALSEEAKAAPALAQAKEQRKAALEAEYHRLLYVALTRPRDALHVYGASSGALKAEGTPSWYQSVDRAMRGMDGVQTLENGALQLGDASGEVEGGLSQGNVTPLEQSVTAPAMPLPLWLHQPPIARGARLARYAPSQLMAGALRSGGVQAKENAASRGVVMHRVLQALHSASTKEAVRALLTHHATAFDAEAQQRMAEEIWRVYRQESWLWEHPAQTEVAITGEIAVHGRQVLITGSIDRLLHLPDALLVVDFKTGHRPAAAPINYCLQLKAYADVLRQIYPTTPIRCGLLWTAEPAFEPADDAIAHCAWPHDFTGNLSKI